MRNPPTLPEISIRTPWLLAIGQALRAGYAEMGESVPERLAALVKKLEGPPSSVRATGDEDHAATAKRVDALNGGGHAARARGA
jgi:hypothetical protein